MIKTDFALTERVESEKKFYGELLRSIVLGFLGLSTGFILFSLLFFKELFPRALMMGGTASFASLFVLWMISRGFVRAAGIFFVSLAWVLVAYLTFTGGGVEAPIFIGNLLLILIASIILGSKAGLWVAVASVSYGILLAAADSNQQLPPDIEYAPFARLFIDLFFFALAFLLQRTAVRATSEAFTRARASEIEYQLFLENIPAITYINDISPESRTTYVSPQVENFIGYTQNEFLKDKLFWTKILHPDDRERVLAESSRTTETREKFIIEYRLITKNGKIVWTRDEALLVYDGDGQPQYWLGVWSDITSIKEAERMQAGAFNSLTRRTNQLQTASEVSRAATSILELDELLPEVVELIRRHFEYYYVGLFLADEKNETLILSAATGEMGKQMIAAKHSLPIGNSSMVGWSVVNNAARIALDVGKDAVRFKNDLLPLSRSELALPLRSRGRVIGAITFQSQLEAAFTESDITALQTMTDQVANSIETARLFNDRISLIGELEAKNAELEQFAYTVSHDLKSPLVTMRGYLGYLREDARKGDFERFDRDLNRVTTATVTMQALLNDLLTLSKVGRTVDTAGDVSLADVTANVLELIHINYEEKKVQIKIANNLPIVHVNRTRLSEIIQNLLTNALKFSGEQPLPLVEVGYSGFDESTKYPIIFVKDNGIGIESKYHKLIFGLFNRLNPQMEGTGVGLTLVKRIVEMYGGRIWVDSDGTGNGCTFYFTLPPAE